ncbi:MAG: hypothetical protein IKJ11_00070 [Clostridia bacterium]|nr:hypothetical protein [Clostridia bacterium]
MKPICRTMMLLLCLLLVCTASSASAATKKVSKTFTTAPTIKFTDAPSRGTASGDSNDVTISASLPGFFNLYLLDENGSTVLTIAKNLEISSKETTFDFYAIDDNGELIEPGTYTFSADMVSQFGVASKVVTKSTKILESKDKNVASAAGRTGSSSTSSSSTASSTSSTGSSSSASSAAKPKATPVPEVLTYTEGKYAMGDEGLLVGVGVSDAATQSSAGYWSLKADASDAEIWAAITRPMTGVDVGENESAYIYDSPESGRAKIGTVSGISQGLNVITERDDGWALVEAFRNEDGAFVRGYIKAAKLRTVEPNATYGIVIDKAKQTLTVYKDGARLGSCSVTTGLATPKYPHRETPAGEFITVTRRGAYEYYGSGYTKYTIRINGSYYLAEIPTTKKNGTKFIEDVEASLGSKGTRGNICIAHAASSDGGINAKWIWDMTDTNKKVKVLIFDDKPRTDVPVSVK